MKSLDEREHGDERASAWHTMEVHKSNRRPRKYERGRVKGQKRRKVRRWWRERDRRRAREAKGEGSLNELNVCHPVVRHYSRLTGRVANPISNIFSSLRRISGPPLCCRPNGLHVVVGSAPRVQWDFQSRGPEARSSIPISFPADPRRRSRFVRPSGKFFSIFWPTFRALNTKQRPVDLPNDSYISALWDLVPKRYQVHYRHLLEMSFISLGRTILNWIWYILTKEFRCMM